MRDFGIDVFAVAGEELTLQPPTTIEAVAACDPQIVMDGADLDTALHTKARQAGARGGRHRDQIASAPHVMAAEGTLAYPCSEHQRREHEALLRQPLRHGVPVHARFGIVRATNRLLCGRTIVISGYGYCGNWPAYARRAWACASSCKEVDPLKALEAHGGLRGDARGRGGALRRRCG